MDTNLRKFENLLRSGESIYIRNNSQPRGQIVVSITDPGTGRQRQLEVPKTWIPLNITDMLPRETLERSYELREFLRKDMIEVMDPKQAELQLNSDKGQKEHRRLNQSKFSVGANSSEQQSIMASNAIGSTALDNPNVSHEEAQLHPRMQPWEQRVLAGEIDGDALVSELEIHTSEFTRQDLQYLIAATFPDDAKAWAQEKLKAGLFREKPVQSNVVPPSSAPQKRNSSTGMSPSKDDDLWG